MTIEPQLVPPGTYTVKMLDENRVEVVEGPYKGQIIFARMTPFQVKIEHKEIRPGEVVNYVN